MNSPKRRIEFKIEGGSDSFEDLANALKNFSEQIRRGEIVGPNGCSGGYDGGYTYEIIEHENITHDSWFANLERYLEWQNSKCKHISDGVVYSTHPPHLKCKKCEKYYYE